MEPENKWFPARPISMMVDDCLRYMKFTLLGSPAIITILIVITMQLSRVNFHSNCALTVYKLNWHEHGQKWTERI